MPERAAFPATQIQVASVTLSSAQILASHTTGVNVVAAPGAGFALIPTEMVLNYTFATTAYTDGGGNLQLQWGTTGGQAVTNSTIPTAALWAQTHSTVAFRANMAVTTALNLATTVANQPLAAQQDTANPTLGDGTVTVTVAYLVVPVS